MMYPMGLRGPLPNVPQSTVANASVPPVTAGGIELSQGESRVVSGQTHSKTDAAEDIADKSEADQFEDLIGIMQPFCCRAFTL